MLEVYLRPIYQACLVDPVAKAFSRQSPMMITYLACLTGMLVAPALLMNYASVAIMLLLMSGFLDTLDGTVARINNKVSDQGIIFDIISDRAVEAAVILGLFAVDPANRGLQSLMMLASCYVSMTSFLVAGVFSLRAQKQFQYTPGIIERTEAFLFFILMIIFPAQFSVLAWTFVSLVLLTTYLHVSKFLVTAYQK